MVRAQAQMIRLLKLKRFEVFMMEMFELKCQYTAAYGGKTPSCDPLKRHNYTAAPSSLADNSK